MEPTQQPVVTSAVSAQAPTIPAATVQQNTKNVAPVSIELAGSYNLATRRIYSDGLSGPKVNTAGADITFLHHFNAKHAFTFRVGYSTGSDDVSESEYYFYRIGSRYSSYTTTVVNINYDFDVSNLYFMPGYRGSTWITDNASLFWGFNVGFVNEKVKAKISSGRFSESISGSDSNFAYSAEIGVDINLSPKVGLILAVNVIGSFAEPEKDGLSTNNQVANPGFRAGVSINF